MAKFRGKIGYIRTVDSGNGVWSEEVFEHYHSGDVIKSSRRWQSGDKVNDDLELSETISIIADSFATSNLSCMKYVERMGALWTITSVEVQRPRLILTLGGVYNGPTPEPAADVGTDTGE